MLLLRVFLCFGFLLLSLGPCFFGIYPFGLLYEIQRVTGKATNLPPCYLSVLLAKVATTSLQRPANAEHNTRLFLQSVGCCCA
jgi:hypothetical protein